MFLHWVPRRRLLPAPRPGLHVARLSRFPILAPVASPPVVLLQAPAGFGKSTLLEECWSAIRGSGQAAAWWTADSSDAAPGRLLGGIAWSVQHAGVDLTDTGLLTQEPNPALSVEQLSAGISAAAARAATPLTLMLDGIERVAGYEGLLRDLLALLAPEVRLIVALASPFPPSAELLAQGLASQIGATDLQFTNDDIAALLQVPASIIPEVADRSGRWPIALQFLRLTVQPGEPILAALARLGAAGSPLDHYVAKQVLERLPSEVAEQLEAAAVLDYIDAGLAEALRFPGHQVRLLNELWRLTGLVDVQPGPIVRMPPLLRALLKGKFAGRPPAIRTLIERSVATVLAHRGEYRAAVLHATAAGDFDGAARIVLDAGVVRIWLRFGFDHLRDIQAALPVDQLRRHPRLRLGIAILHWAEGRLAATRELLQELQPEPNTNVPTGDERVFLEELASVNILLLLHEDVVTQQRLRMLERERTQVSAFYSDEIAVLLGCVRVVSHQQRGDFDGAARQIPEIRALLQRCRGSAINDYFLNIYEGWIAGGRGSLDEALAWYERAESLIKGGLEGDAGGLAVLHETMIAETLHLMGQYERSAARLGPVIEAQVHSISWFDFQAAAYSTYVTQALRSDGTETALDIVERGRRDALRREARGFARFCDSLELLVLVRARRWTRATSLIARLDLLSRAIRPPHPQAVAWRERELLLTALIERAIGTGSFSFARESIVALHLHASETGRVPAGLRADFLLATLLRRQGSRHQSATVLRDLIPKVIAMRQLALADEYLVGLSDVLDDALLADVIRRHEATLTILKRVEQASADDATGKDAPVQLTDRERVVLQRAEMGETNKMIARRLDISENTVKFHFKQAGRKLGQAGAGRMALVEAARSRRLLGTPDSMSPARGTED